MDPPNILPENSLSNHTNTKSQEVHQDGAEKDKCSPSNGSELQKKTSRPMLAISYALHYWHCRNRSVHRFIPLWSGRARFTISTARMSPYPRERSTATRFWIISCVCWRLSSGFPLDGLYCR